MVIVGHSRPISAQWAARAACVWYRSGTNRIKTLWACSRKHDLQWLLFQGTSDIWREHGVTEDCGVTAVNSLTWHGPIEFNMNISANKSTKIDTKHWKWHRHWPSRHSPVFSPGWTFARSQRNGHSTYAFCTHGRRSRTFLSKRTLKSWTHGQFYILVWWFCFEDAKLLKIQVLGFKLEGLKKSPREHFICLVVMNTPAAGVILKDKVGG